MDLRIPYKNEDFFRNPDAFPYGTAIFGQRNGRNGIKKINVRVRSFPDVSVSDRESWRYAAGKNLFGEPFPAGTVSAHSLPVPSGPEGAAFHVFEHGVTCGTESGQDQQPAVFRCLARQPLSGDVHQAENGDQCEQTVFLLEEYFPEAERLRRGAEIPQAGKDARRPVGPAPVGLPEFLLQVLFLVKDVSFVV